MRAREQLDIELRTAQLAEAAQVQAVQVGRIGLRGLVGEVGTHVDRVADQQSASHGPLEPMDRCRQEGRADGHRVGDHEEQDVAAQHAHAHPHVRPPPSAPGQDDDADAGDEHRQRGEHERGPQDRADAHLGGVAGIAAKHDRSHDGDDRDQGLRHRGGHRRQDAADRPFGQVQLMAEPLDAIGEQLGSHQDERKRSDQQDEVHRILLRLDGAQPRRLQRRGSLG